MTTGQEHNGELDRLRERVAEYWPGYGRRFTASQAAGILRRFRRWPVADLLVALAAHYDAEPDGRAPVWAEVWNECERLAGQAIETDEAGYYRRWWRSWQKLPQVRDDPARVAWALEIMTCDDRTRVGPQRTVMPADYAAWHAAAFRCGDWQFYLAGRPWWPADGGPVVLDVAGERVELRRGARGAPPPNERRVAALQECHRLVRNLRTFGPATRAWKAAALAALEAEARTGGVRIDGVESLEELCPF